MAITKYDSLFNTRHPELKKREDNWKLIYNSYVGGVEYSNAGYLIQYPKESLGSFRKRKERAVYFNQMSPIVDMISGMLFLKKPTRKIPKELKYLEESINITGNKTINEFMRLVAAYSFMFTCGILVDSPDFDPEIIKTPADRRENKLNPYTVLYLPFKIRDFYINDKDGELEWVLLDNSYIDHSDPFQEGKKIHRYTLWDRSMAIDYEKRDINDSTVTIAREKYHNLGIVPFKFISWRDDNNDFIAETVCEDIAMVSKLIYNNMSYMDEMLASGTFKMLVYPSKSGEVPEELKIGGVGPLSIIPVEKDAAFPPQFIGAELSQIDPFIKAINFYMTEILKKVGMSTDEMKEFVKSGTAKRIDLEKMRALLTSGAMMMSKLEEWVISTAGKWEGKDLTGKANYTEQYSSEDLETEMTLLTEMLIHPFKTLRTETLNLMVRKALGNYLEPEKLEEIQKEISEKMGEEGIMSNTGSVPQSSTPIINRSGSGSVQNIADKILKTNTGVQPNEVKKQ